jgi:hypothetical protein
VNIFSVVKVLSNLFGFNIVNLYHYVTEILRVPVSTVEGDCDIKGSFKNTHFLVVPYLGIFEKRNTCERKIFAFIQARFT